MNSERCGRHGKRKVVVTLSLDIFINYLAVTKPVLGHCSAGSPIHVILISEEFLNQTRNNIKLGNYPSKIFQKYIGSRYKRISHQKSASLP